MRTLRPLLALAIALPFAVAAAAAGRRPAEPASVREPVENLNATALVSRTGSATVTSSGRRDRVRLRRQERLTEIAEAGGGWVAAGLRARSTGSDLVVVARRSSARGGAARVPSPARGGERHRVAPRILIESDELAGIAWLEGARPDRMAVRAAQWSGADWTASTVVSAPGPGSQTGLAQAVLTDGSWLLVWSRFDGRENELYWSLRLGGNWTPPAPVERDDGVPDVTPTLLATADGGALLAWSEYDGRDYRLRGARFGGDGWSRLALDAGPGALHPKFRRGPEGTWVLVRAAVPRGWAALEVRPDGSPGRIARVETESLERPLLRPGGAGMVFEWTGSRRLSAAWRMPR